MSWIAILLALLALLLAFAAGVALGVALSGGKRASGLSAEKLGSVTRRLFVATLWAAIVWVSWSYLLATYAIIRLGVVYTMEELSKPAITAILGVTVAKVVGNIFEHNESAVFGVSSRKAVSESDTAGDL